MSDPCSISRSRPWSCIAYQASQLGRYAGFTPVEHLVTCRVNFKRATEELTALVRQAYIQHADKAVQELIFEDALSAIRHCSRSRQQLYSGPKQAYMCSVACACIQPAVGNDTV